MSRGDLQSLPVQQMMAGNPNWLNIYSTRPPSHQTNRLLPYIPSSSSSSTSPNSPFSVVPPFLPPNSLPMNSSLHETQDQMPESWSQLLMDGLVGEDDRCSLNFFEPKKVENWPDQMLYPSGGNMLVVKEESSEGGHIIGRRHESAEIQAVKSHLGHVLPACSPGSCVSTSLSTNMLDFSSSCRIERNHIQQSDHSLEGESNLLNGTTFKKARIQSSSQSTFKVRKEKLGDRITALHQLVSPFGKTDTASVLLEAFGYIRFLQSQIEALSSPYMGNASTSGTMRQPAQGERTNCVFPEDPGQLLDDASIKGRGGSSDKGGGQEPKRDLRSRGLCLVPLACTSQVGSDNGADYWAPALGRGF